MRKVLVASTIVLVGLSVALADEFSATITKVDGNKVSLKKKTKDKKVEECTLDAVKGVKVVKGVFNKETKKLEAGDAIEGGLGGLKIGEKGVGARIITDTNNCITEIRVFAKKKKDAK